MTNFSVNPHDVRVDVFRSSQSGKWYQTVTLDMSKVYWETDLRVSLSRLWREQYGNMNAGMWAVCLDPYHQHSHPQMWQIEHVAGSVR